MKHLVFIVLFFLQEGKVYSQKIDVFKSDFGIKLVSTTLPKHLNISVINRSYAEFMAGLFYRVSNGKKYFRAGFDFSKNQKYSNHGIILLSGEIKDKSTMDFKFWVGGEYHPFKKKSFYLFTDLYCRRRLTSGAIFNEEEVEIKSLKITSSMVGLNEGFGFKFKISRDFYLSPEFFFDIFYFQVQYYSLEKKSNKETLSNRSGKQFQPGLRLFLTLGF